MQQTLTRDTLIKILDCAGIEAEDIVYGWVDGLTGYSGRYMYDGECFALAPGDVGLVLMFFQGLGGVLADAADRMVALPEGNELLETMADGAHTDSLGRRSVYYFPSWVLEPEEGDG